MINSSRTLLAIAAIAAAPAAWGLDVSDADLKLGLTMQLQARAEASMAEDNTGAAYSVAEGSTGGPDTADFYLRRVRLGFTGMYKEKFKFAAILNADNTDKGQAAETSRFARPHAVFVGTSFACPLSESIKHYVQVGLDDAAYNGSQNIFSSRELLMPATRASGNFMKARGVGVKYSVTAPNVQGWIDVQNNTGDTSTDVTSNTGKKQGDGLWYSARVHVSPEGEWKIAKATESFLGAAGKGLLVAVDGAINDNDAAAGTEVTTTGYGIEVLGHFDAITALVEFRAQEQSGNGTQKDGVVALAQAGYAMPWKDYILEPAFRVSVIDTDKNLENEATAFGSNDYGASGLQWELGANLYLNKHNNKIQAAWTNWDGEGGQGNAKAKADIVRVQWQLAF